MDEKLLRIYKNTSEMMAIVNTGVKSGALKISGVELADMILPFLKKISSEFGDEYKK